MGSVNSTPVVSQVKSGVQLVCGDKEGAAKTQEQFFHECPVVSQGVSIGYLLAGEKEAAIETQKRCGKGLLNAIDGVPVVGHVKGGIHYLAGDEEGGAKAMKSATRTTGVVAGGVGGFFLGGPVGAIAGGVYGGAMTDMTTSLVTNEPSGYVAAIQNAVKNPNPGDIFDLCLMPIADGLTGYSAGSVVRRLTSSQPQTGPSAPQARSDIIPQQTDLVKAGELRAQAQQMYQAAEANAPNVPEIRTLTEMNKVAELWKAADKLEGKVQASIPKPQMAAPANQVYVAAQVGEGLSKQELEQDLRPRQTQGQRQQDKRRNKTESDSDSDEEDCTCHPIEVPVLYANMRSINPKNQGLSEKFARFRKAIQRNDPAIIAIVETWLNEKHLDANVVSALGLDGYTIWRQDRYAGHHPNNAYGDTTTSMEGRRGGGILIAWKPITLNNGNLLVLIRNPSEDFGDAIMSADIKVQMNCTKCNEANNKKFAFTVIYRRPVPQGDEAAEEINNEVLNRLTHMGSVFNDELLDYSGWSMVGDFNWRQGWDDENVPNLLMFVPDDATIFPDMRTHERGGCLDLVIASNEHVNGVVVSKEPISDHHALIYKLNFGTDYGRSEPCQRCQRE